MSQTDFARFIEIATGSVFEVVSQSFTGRQQGFLNEENFRAMYSAADEIGRMLSGLRKSLALE
jgi:four helix bundle protein